MNSAAKMLLPALKINCLLSITLIKICRCICSDSKHEQFVHWNSCNMQFQNMIERFSQGRHHFLIYIFMFQRENSYCLWWSPHFFPLALLQWKMYITWTNGTMSGGDMDCLKWLIILRIFFYWHHEGDIFGSDWNVSAVIYWLHTSLFGTALASFGSSTLVRLKDFSLWQKQQNELI